MDLFMQFHRLQLRVLIKNLAAQESYFQKT